MNNKIKNQLSWFSGISMGFGTGFLIGKEGLSLILFATALIMIGFILNWISDIK